jgi:hypothetical protein
VLSPREGRIAATTHVALAQPSRRLARALRWRLVLGLRRRPEAGGGGGVADFSDGEGRRGSCWKRRFLRGANVVGPTLERAYGIPSEIRVI